MSDIIRAVGWLTFWSMFVWMGEPDIHDAVLTWLFAL